MANSDRYKEISLRLQEVAAQFGPAARETILAENLGKHAFEIEMILKKCGQGGRILDIGGGMGVNLLCLRKLSPGFELHLIDRFEEYTEDNRMGAGGEGLQLMKESDISVVAQDFWKEPVLPYDSGFFDVVTCLDVFEHLPGHPLRLLGEMGRVMRKGGTAIVSGPNAVSLLTRVRLLLGSHPYVPLELWCKDNYYSHYREYSRDEYRRLLEMSGFSDIDTVMVLEPSCRKVRDKNQRHGYTAPLVAAAVWVIYLITVPVPGLRPTVYGIAKKPASSTS